MNDKIKLEKINNNKYKVISCFTPKDMYIKINNERNWYRAESNYSLWIKKSASSYQPMHLCKSIEETINHMLIYFNSCLNMDLEDFCWVPIKNNKKLILGNGNTISYNDFK